MNLADATHEMFTDAVGDSFSIEADGVTAIELASVDVKTAYDSAARVPFVLTFHGPAETILQQRIYLLEHDKLGQLEIFLVPVSRDDNIVAYEAVFN